MLDAARFVKVGHRRPQELICTAWDLMPFAQDCGWSGPSFRGDEERRLRRTYGFSSFVGAVDVGDSSISRRSKFCASLSARVVSSGLSTMVHKFGNVLD